jgi:superfamily II DNA helicase RecQ
MKYKFFRIFVSDPDDSESQLNSFLGQNRIVHVDRNFVEDADRSHWAFCLAYIDKKFVAQIGKKEKIDYREVLDEKDFAVFAKLRDLRKKISEAEGVPAYALFTNEQLAGMVQQRTISLDKIGTIDGIGKMKLEKYGNAFSEIIKNAFASSRE